MNKEHLAPVPYPITRFRPRSSQKPPKIAIGNNETLSHRIFPRESEFQYFYDALGPWSIDQISLITAFPILFLLNQILRIVQFQLWHLLVLESIMLAFVLVPMHLGQGLWNRIIMIKGGQDFIPSKSIKYDAEKDDDDKNDDVETNNDVETNAFEKDDVEKNDDVETNNDVEKNAFEKDDLEKDDDIFLFTPHVENENYDNKNNNIEMSLRTSTISNNNDQVNLSNNRFRGEIKSMLRHFIDVVESDPIPSLWERVYDSSETIIYQHRSLENCYRIHGILENTPETCFELLADATQRPLFDDMCEEARVIEIIDDQTRIIYVKMKAIWPTAARDCVLLSHMRRLPDGRLLNVTKSVVHPDCPDLESDGVIRMVAGIAGQICSSIDGDGQVPSFCKVIQIVDGDLKGWIPKSVISFIAKKGLPGSLRKLNDIILTLEPIKTSLILNENEAKDSAVDIIEDESKGKKIGGNISVEDLIGSPSSLISSQVPVTEATMKKTASSSLATSRKDDLILAAVKKLQDRISYLENLIISTRNSSSESFLTKILKDLSPYLIFIIAAVSLYQQYRRFLLNKQ